MDEKRIMCDEEYQDAVSKLINEACDAEDILSDDDLEEFARTLTKKERS